MGLSAVSNRSEQWSYRDHSAPLDDAIGRCCSEFGVLAVSSGKVGKVDCCGLMRGAGASTAGLLLSLSLSPSLSLSVACRHCRRRSLTLSRFFLSQGFRSYTAEVCSADLIIMKSTHTLTRVISSHYEVFSWCVSCTKCTNRYLCQVHVLTKLTAESFLRS